MIVTDVRAVAARTTHDEIDVKVATGSAKNGMTPIEILNHVMTSETGETDVIVRGTAENQRKVSLTREKRNTRRKIRPRKERRRRRRRK